MAMTDGTYFNLIVFVMFITLRSEQIHCTEVKKGYYFT